MEANKSVYRQRPYSHLHEHDVRISLSEVNLLEIRNQLSTGEAEVGDTPHLPTGLEFSVENADR